MTRTPSMLFSEEDDFGFSFSDQTEEIKNNEELANRLQMMYDAIIPLLKNLNKNPDQEYIKWPNRIEKVSQFKQKLDQIGGDFVKVKKI
jgi:hypothetical protein